MRVRAHAFWLPKAGNAEEEYEDACWPARPVDRETGVFRCAVADGATEASFAGLWARLLVRAYCRGDLTEARLASTLSTLRGVWLEAVTARPLPWYAEEKVRSGAFAALAGLTLTVSRGEVRWRALAIGDSCLFHLRGACLIGAFPMTSADAFDNHPYLLGSGADPGDRLRRVRGCAQPGDHFLLMTDALAAWALAASQAGCNPWQALSAVRDRPTFDTLIQQLRAEHALRNDDVTLMQVELCSE